MKRFLKILKRTMIVLLCLLIILVLAIFFYLKQPQFGAIPEGAGLESVKKSPNYKDEKFRNYVETPIIAEGYSMWGETWKAITAKYPNTEPVDALPSIKTNLKTIAADSNVMVWFGHSSFFLQVDGVKILVDPVFCGSASPIPGSVKAYKGTDIYTVDDMPEIDYLFLSHDHYDHLDYETTKALQSKVKYVVCGLGAGAHYEKWGYAPAQILEKDWNDTVAVKPGFTIYTENTHHSSGRGFTRDKNLWLAFMIQSPTLNIYYSGDGGYTDRFVAAAKKFPKIDWAIMECGQYNPAWKYNHKSPAEVEQSTSELNARNLIPVHHSKFTLAKHPWYEPLEEITRLSENKSYRLATPMIGELINLNSNNQEFKQWWKGIK